MTETFDDYSQRVHDYIVELKNLHGTQRALAESMGVSDTTISLFLKNRDLGKYPVIWKYLVEEHGFDSPPPVDPRHRRWMRTDDWELALLTFVETYPDIPLYFEVEEDTHGGPTLWARSYVLITQDLLQGE